MPFIPVPDVLQAELRYTLFGQRIENVLYFAGGGRAGQAGMNTLALQLQAWWVAEIAPNLSVQLTLNEIYITDLQSESGETYSGIVAAGSQGQINDNALPGNVALCVSFRTAQRGRSFRGRNYVPGLAETSVAGNTVEAGVVNNLQAGYGALISTAAAAGFPWVVVSRYSGGDPRPVGLATNITGARVVDPFVDSQRRRLTGRGL